MASASVAVFREKGFPAHFADEPSVDPLSILAEKGLGAEALPLDLMSAALASGGLDLAVFATGALVPLDLWPALREHIERGGHVLWLGGPPLESGVARRDGGRFVREGREGLLRRALGVVAAAEVPAETIARYAIPEDAGGNPLGETVLNALPLETSFALTIARADRKEPERARVLRPLVHGIGFDGLARSAPIVAIDRLEGPGAGGRAVLLTLAGRRLAALAPILPALAAHALEGASELVIEPELATYYAGEKPAVRVVWRCPGRSAERRLKIRVHRDEAGEPVATAEATVAGGDPERVELRVPFAFEASPGLYRVFADVADGDGRPRGTLRTGFYGFDEDMLSRARRLRPDGAYFYGSEEDVEPIVGTAYLDPEWGPHFFLHPNADRWDRDLARLRAIGIGLIRTGLSTGWTEVMGEDQMFREESLRAFDALFHAAAAHGIQVAFTSFSGVPDAWGSGHPYVAPSRLAFQRTFVEVLSRRFRDHKNVVFELIEAPVFGRRRGRNEDAAPHGDDDERLAWEAFLRSRHGDPLSVALAWEVEPRGGPDLGRFAPPRRPERGPRNALVDWRLFSQEAFAGWSEAMSSAMKKKSRHLVTIGQRAPDGTTRPAPAFYKAGVDFTLALSPEGDSESDPLFDVLASRTISKPCLLVGTRSSPMPLAAVREEAARDRLEREAVLAIAGAAAGYVGGPWNAAADVAGAVAGARRSDGSFSLETEVYTALSKFLAKIAPFMTEPRTEDIAIVLSHSAVVRPDTGARALLSARRAARALQILVGREASIVHERGVKDAGRRRLFVLPSVGHLSEDAWKSLLRAVRGGSRLLLSGPAGADEYGVERPRLAPFDVEVARTAVAREEAFRLGRRPLALRYDEGDRERIAKDVVTRRGRASRRRGDLHEFEYGLGKVLYSSLPIEANASRSALAAFYEFACRWAGVETVYRVRERDPAVLVRAVVYGRSRLFGVVSQTSEERTVEILDRPTGARVKTVASPGRANLILVRDSGEIIKMREA